MNRVLLATAALACGVASCTGDAPGANTRGLNDLSMRLTLPDGQRIDVVHYAVSGGPQNVHRNGDQNVGQSSLLKFRIGDLPVGGGYTMQLSAITDTGTGCAGSAPFAIGDSDVTTLDMMMVCRGAEIDESDTDGDVEVNVDVAANPTLVCPVATGVSLLPAQAQVGAALQIEGFSSSAPDSASWSSSSGSFGDAAASATSFSCASVGDVTLSFTIQKAGCAASQVSAVATCGAPGTPSSTGLLTLANTHACQVLANDGRIVCWGTATSGVLGNGPGAVTSSHQLSANFIDSTMLPQGLQTTWKSVSAALSRTCAITFAGDGYCWGVNASGQLGTRAVAVTGAPVPIDVSALPAGTKWSSLTGGTSTQTTCGITSRGTGYCWGSNSSGQVGNPAAAASQQVPLAIDVSALPASTTWSVLSTGQTHTCGVTTTGAAYCWGADAGRLGNGPTLTASQNSPSAVDMTTLPAGTTWATISAGNSHTCGVTTSGDAYCWGSDANAKLGNGAAETADQDHPVLVSRDALRAGSGWARISAGLNHSCGVATDGAAFCWGAGSAVLGDGAGTTEAPSPRAIDISQLPPDTTWAAVQVANTHACGMTTTGTSYCWGFDTQGRLGNGPASAATMSRPQTPVVTGVGVVGIPRWKVAGAISDPTNVKLSFSVVPVQLSALNAMEAAAAGISVTVQSANEAVLPTANITFSGSGTQRFASFNPTGVGTAVLTFNVSDSAGNQNVFSITYGASGAPASPSGRYHMGLTDASTAIDVGDGYMLLGDDETQVIYLHAQNQSGYPIKTWDLTDPNLLSSNERDIEAAARVGDLIVWTTSQGNARDGAIKEYRRMLFATRISGRGANTELTFAGRYGGGPISKDAQAAVGLRNDLLAWDQNNGHGLGANFLGLVAASAAGVLPNAPNGMNVEGLEFAADGTTGLLGFRAPTLNVGGTQHALIVPITNILDLVNGVPAQQSGLATFGAPILLNLAGRSIRELRRNDMGQYMIVAGPPDNPTVGVNDTWALYAWDGEPAHPPTLNQLLPDANYLTGGAWEGLLSVPNPIAAGAEVLVLADSGDTLFFGTSNLNDYGKSYSQKVTLK